MTGETARHISGSRESVNVAFEELRQAQRSGTPADVQQAEANLGDARTELSLAVRFAHPGDRPARQDLVTMRAAVPARPAFREPGQ